MIILPEIKKELRPRAVGSIVVVVAAAVALPFFLNSLDSRGISVFLILSLAGFLAFIAYYSKRTWIPILICGLIIRDFSLGDLVGGGTLKIGDILIGYIFLLWLTKDILIDKKTTIIKSKLDAALLLFVGLHIASLLWSADMDLGLVRVFKLLRDLMFFFILRELFLQDFRGNFRRATLSYAITSIILLSVYAHVVLSSGDLSDILSLSGKATLTSVDLGALRVRGTGGGFLITGPCAWFLMTFTFLFGSLIFTGSPLKGSLKLLLLFIFLMGTLVTLQRSIMVQVGIFLLCLLAGSIYLKTKRNIVFISVLLLIFLVAGASLNLGKIFSGRFQNAFKDGSWVQRVELYTAAIDAFKKNPILGIGAGSNYSWQEKFPELGENRSRLVHSTYLIILSELGIMGFLVFTIVIFLWLQSFWKCVRNSRNEAYLRNICMVFLAFTVSYLLYIVQVGEFEEFEPWLLLAVGSATTIANKSEDNSKQFAFMVKKEAIAKQV